MAATGLFTHLSYHILRAVIVLEEAQTNKGFGAPVAGFRPATFGYMNRGLFALDTIITMAPLLGILGTVLGIIDCFGFLSTATYIDPSLISSGIAQALVSTAAGLSVSLMTLIPYNWFLEKQRREVMRIMALKGEK